MNVLKTGFQPLPSPLGAPHLRRTPGLAFWFGLSFLPPLYFGLLSLWHVQTHTYIVQDDARLHLVWWQRLVDSGLFPQDAIADYFMIIQPAGFKGLFTFITALGIDPMAFAKIVPLTLALITTSYLFWVALMLLPVPLCGALTSLILNQNIWIRDDLISAAPRAFVYPIFSAFLFYLLRNQQAKTLIVLALLGLFYPQMMLVGMGLLTLRLVDWPKNWSGGWPRNWPRSWPCLPRRLEAYIPWLIGLVLTGGLLGLFSTQVTQQVGSLTSLEQMQTWPEFQAQGRGEYFGLPALAFWFDGSSGLRFPLFPPIIWLGALLPWVVLTGSLRIKTWLKTYCPAGAFITVQVGVLAQLLLATLGLFGLAHGLFPRLYLPSRYTFYSTRFVLILATGVMLTLLLQAWLKWLRAQKISAQKRILLSRQTKKIANTSLFLRLFLKRVAVLLSCAFAIAVLITPAIPSLFLGGQGWVIGQLPEVYDEIATTPKSSLVASLVTEINDNIPAFSNRSVLVGREFALPYHASFYQLMRQRMADLLTAQYSSDLSVVKAFVTRYGIDIWVVSEAFATPSYLNHQIWLLNSTVKEDVLTAQRSLQSGQVPALLQTLPICTRFSQDTVIVLDAHCITNFRD
ncbi:MAG: hypothetical protein AAFV90_28580 [Cyanobacteria bacterium J06634_5]